jgi:hypothetical protein
VVSNVEVFEIKADFFRDSDGEIWFCHARDILYRNRKRTEAELDQLSKLRKEAQLQEQKRQ